MCADYRLISIKSGYIFAVVWNFEGQLQRVTIMYDFKILPKKYDFKTQKNNYSAHVDDPLGA